MSECIFRNVKWRPKTELNGKSVNLTVALMKDKLEEGKQVNHTCGNSNCINPEHLYIGTQLDNMKDRVKDGHWKSGYVNATHCIRGHELTPENTRQGNSQRFCRECDKIRSREYRKRKPGRHGKERIRF